MTDPAGGPWFATAFGAHYPLLYRHRDADEAARAVALLPTLAPLHEPILDLGCGDGRHLALLAPQRREFTEPDVLRAAVEVLGRMDGPAARAALTGAQDDPDPAVADAARQALEGPPEKPVEKKVPKE